MDAQQVAVEAETDATLRRDLDLCAQSLARLHRDVDRREEGVRADFTVALLEEHMKLVRRFERLEALVAERVGGDVADAVTRTLSLVQ